MKRSTAIAVGILLTMTVAWAAFGQAAGGGGARRGGGMRGGFGRMGEAQQKAVADLQAQSAKLKTLIDENTKAMEGGFQNMSEEDRAKMKERGTEIQKLVADIQKDVDALRFFQIAREHNQQQAALKEALASAEKEKATETAKMLEQVIAQNQKAFEERGAALGYTPEQMQRMGQARRGGSGQ
jgi:hypothetical protein